MLGLLSAAVLVAFVAAMSDSFKRTVLTGDGGLFEDSLDKSGERCVLSLSRPWFDL